MASPPPWHPAVPPLLTWSRLQRTAIRIGPGLGGPTEVLRAWCDLGGRIGMKFVLFNDHRLGLLRDDGVVDLSDAIHPLGVGNGQAAMEALITQQEGDTIDVEIERVGRFSFQVTDPLQRRWPKGVDELTAQDIREGTGPPGSRQRPL